MRPAWGGWFARMDGSSGSTGSDRRLEKRTSAAGRPGRLLPTMPASEYSRPGAATDDRTLWRLPRIASGAG